MDLTEARHAFVTGGASGIGLAIAKALADRGVAVTVADINAQSISAVTTDSRLRGQLLDTRDRAAWILAKNEAEAALGAVDVLVLNAGIAPDGTHLADMDPVSFDRVVAINLTGVFNGISAFGADMRARERGHIVTTSSMSGMAADWPGLGSYSGSKFAVVAMTEVLRMEMAPHGVGVSAFCPGTTATNLMANSRALGSNTQGGADASLLGMPVQPAEVAAKVLRGIEENRAYIFTHPERRATVERRFSEIMAGFDAG